MKMTCRLCKIKTDRLIRKYSKKLGFCGYWDTCLDCKAAKERERRINTEYAASQRQACREYYARNKPMFQEKQRLFQKNNPNYGQEYLLKNPTEKMKREAREAFRYAVIAGKIKKPPTCEDCKKPSLLDGHHEDYSKALEVAWLCRACHGKRHRI